MQARVPDTPSPEQAVQEPRATVGRTRRQPVQERSAETVQKINDATSRLLGQGVSVEELTTSQIAVEAGVSVGSLYRFFPDKQAILDALAVLRMEEFQQALMLEITPTLFQADGPALLAQVIDAFVAFLDLRSDFRMIAFGGRHISRRTREEQSGAEAGAATLVKQYMVAVLGMADTPELELRLRIASEIGDRLLAFALEHDKGEARDRIVGEMKRLLAVYLFG